MTGYWKLLRRQSLKSRIVLRVKRLWYMTELTSTTQTRLMTLRPWRQPISLSDVEVSKSLLKFRLKEKHRTNLLKLLAS